MDYHTKENIKWIVTTILILLFLLWIAGIADIYEEKKHDKAFQEGYEEALYDYGIDE